MQVRRMGTAATAALFLATTFGFAAETAPTRENYLRIAGECEANLEKEILDKWFPAAVDERGGGFFEKYSLDWTRTDGNNKSIVYQSRCTWLSAQAARRFPDEAELYLAMTRRGAACLANKMWDQERGGFYWTIDGDGRPTSGVKQMYGHAFGIYALAAGYQAARDPNTLRLAKEAFRWLEEHAHDGQNKGYCENIGADGKPDTSLNEVGAQAGQKSMNTSIHILEALTGLYQVWPDPAVKARVQEMLEICRDKIYAEPGYLTQFFTADWQRTPGPDSFGHDVETGFLMVEAAETLGQGDDPRLWAEARRLVDHALQYGWDKDRGGLYDSGAMTADGAVTGPLRTEKIWWVQAEMLNALLLQHDHFGKETPRYWDAFVKQWDWIAKYQIDHANGGWWPTVRADGAPASTVKADTWTECYHQGRAMLNVSERLRKLADDTR
jgi:mannobiose 2-epimerase